MSKAWAVYIVYYFNITFPIAFTCASSYLLIWTYIMKLKFFWTLEDVSDENIDVGYYIISIDVHLKKVKGI